MEDPDISSFPKFAEKILSVEVLSPTFNYLQQQCGFQLNVLLYLLWLSKARFGRLTKKQLRQLLDFMMSWHQRVISELQYAYALVADQSGEAAQGIQQILALEIAQALKIEQEMLFESQIKSKRLQRSPKQQLVDACASIKHYCAVKKDVLMRNDQPALMALCAAVFDEVSHQTIESQVSQIFENTHGLAGQLAWDTF